jgi:hypothetical protein
MSTKAEIGALDSELGREDFNAPNFLSQSFPDRESHKDFSFVAGVSIQTLITS